MMRPPGPLPDERTGVHRRTTRVLLSIATASWPLLQTTTAVALAWTLAIRITGNPAPFFAPIAAVIALNGPRGERGSQAVRILAGVFLGIAVGEATVALFGGGLGWLLLATFTAMAIAQAAGASRIVIIQAGGSAILTVAAAEGEAGIHRLIEALIGSGVALVFSQVLFSPEPVGLLRRAEAAALERIARGLDLTARALETDDPKLADEALAALRETRTQLGELARIHKASSHVARHSAIWRSQMAPLVRERGSADHLDLLGGGAVMLARTAFTADARHRAIFATHIGELTSVLHTLAASPDDRATRQGAVDRALEVSGRIATEEAAPDGAKSVPFAMLQMLALDIMIFSGVGAEEAEGAVQSDVIKAHVPAPPAAPRIPFGLDRLAPDRWWPGQSSPASPLKVPREGRDRTGDDREQ